MHEILSEVKAELNNNLNSAAAFAIIDANTLIIPEYWHEIDALFGLGIYEDASEPSPEQLELIKKWEEAYDKHDYVESDAIREDLKIDNFRVTSTPKGPIWQYIR